MAERSTSELSPDKTLEPKAEKNLISPSRLSASAQFPDRVDSASTLSSTTTTASFPTKEAVSNSFGPYTLTVTVPVPGGSKSVLSASDGSDRRSFSELLAGAMASNSPVPVVASACFVAPPELIKSPRFTEHLGMTHQEVLASVTAQAKMQLQSGHSSPSSRTISQPKSAVSPISIQRSPSGLEETIVTPEAEQLTSTDQKSKSSHVVVKTASNDGYNWRKYGQKQVKSSENSRSYYRCTTAHCFAKKKVEHCQDGRVIEVVYRGEHNHGPPQKKCPKEREPQGSQSSGPLKDEQSSDLPSEALNYLGNCSSKNNHNSGNETPEKLHCSSDCEGDPGTNTEEDLGEGPDPKRRLCEVPVSYSASLFRTVREPKVVVQTACDGGPTNDGYRWRKYGQKTVKGNPNPRSYYKCTHTGCPVRKHVERVEDAKVILTTYEGKHNHDLPSSKTSNDLSYSRSSYGSMKTSNSSGMLQPHEHKPEKGKATVENTSEPGGEKIIESAKTLLGIAYESKSGEGKSIDNSEVIQRPLFDENPAAVPVKNS